MFGLKTGELIIIFALLLLLFGGSRLPQLGSALGRSIRNFKKGFSSDGEAAEEQEGGGGKALASSTEVKAGDKAPSKV